MPESTGMQRTARTTAPWGRRLAAFAIAGAALMTAIGLIGGEPVPAAGRESNATLAGQVRAAEIAFAKTMADRDLDAFATHVADDAVFFGKTVMRGRAAVVAGWAGLFEGSQAPFSWKPDQVEVLDSGKLAISTGPVLDPEGKRTGTFNTIWRREADGVWRVIFDRGCPPCEAPPQP